MASGPPGQDMNRRTAHDRSAYLALLIAALAAAQVLALAWLVARDSSRAAQLACWQEPRERLPARAPPPAIRDGRITI